MTARQEIIDLYRKHVNSGLARIYRLLDSPLECRSEGNLIYDEADRAYLECGGYCVFLLGHRHPEVTEAVRAQLDRHPISSRLLVNQEVAHAAAALAAVAPKGLSYVWLASSGAEVVEAALKLARLQKRDRLVTMTGGFHGKTLGALSVMGNELYREPFEPLLPNVTRIPFGDAQRLRDALSEDGGRTCVFLEPIQSEAGVRIPPAGYLRDVERICRDSGAFLVLDEISTGLGRTGAWWAADHEGVTPDVLLVGKALGGGLMPVSALVATPEAFAPFNREPFLHSSTFAGNPLAAAAARASLGVIERQGIVDVARSLGARLEAALTSIARETGSHLIREVRGAGLLLGIEFVEEHHAADFMLEMLHRRVLVSHSFNGHRTVRFTPPALLSEAEIDWMLGAVQESVEVLCNRYRPTG